jgi:acyl-CoA synthetase (AMP-forming)/AMP-acid ligase II
MPAAALDNSIYLDGRWVRWRDLGDAPFDYSAAARLNCFVVSSFEQAFACCAELARAARNAMVLPRDHLAGPVAELLRQGGAPILHPGKARAHPASDVGDGSQTRISILTSGTTGVPKLVAHTWSTLFTARRARDLRPRTWVLPYQVGSYAWYQVVTLGLFAPGHRLIPAEGTDVALVMEQALAGRADAISSTPTFWRLALLAVSEATLRAIPFAQVSLGGEIVDHSLLTQLRALYPHASITHIYASTEAGASIVVGDGQAGFPAQWLRDGGLREGAPGGIDLKVEQGRLFVRSPYSSHAAQGRPGQWVDTGDRVELRADRVLFLGRSETELINVGGNKAFPADIEAVLLTHPRVAWCRVSARKASIVGSLPSAEVLLRDKDTGTAEADLFRHCRERLPEYAIPRIWSFVERIPLATTLKSGLRT